MTPEQMAAIVRDVHDWKNRPIGDVARDSTGIRILHDWKAYQ